MYTTFQCNILDKVLDNSYVEIKEAWVFIFKVSPKTMDIKKKHLQIMET